MQKVMTVLLTLLVAVSLSAAGVDKDHLAKYGRGIIDDYSDMKESDDIEWVWVDPGVKLHDYQYKIEPFENLTVLTDRKMDEVFEDTLPRTLARAGAKDDAAPVLTVEGAIFWAERANRSKWWIPYAGMHLAQAGIGIEVIFKNEKGEVVAKIRHSGREGDDLENAAEELVDDLARFVRAN